MARDGELAGQALFAELGICILHGQHAVRAAHSGSVFLQRRQVLIWQADCARAGEVEDPGVRLRQLHRAAGALPSL